MPVSERRATRAQTRSFQLRDAGQEKGRVALALAVMLNPGCPQTGKPMLVD